MGKFVREQAIPIRCPGAELPVREEDVATGGKSVGMQRPIEVVGFRARMHANGSKINPNRPSMKVRLKEGRALPRPKRPKMRLSTWLSAEAADGGARPRDGSVPGFSRRWIDKEPAETAEIGMVDRITVSATDVGSPLILFGQRRQHDRYFRQCC